MLEDRSLILVEPPQSHLSLFKNTRPLRQTPIHTRIETISVSRDFHDLEGWTCEGGEGVGGGKGGEGFSGTLCGGGGGKGGVGGGVFGTTGTSFGASLNGGRGRIKRFQDGGTDGDIFSVKVGGDPTCVFNLRDNALATERRAQRDEGVSMACLI